MPTPALTLTLEPHETCIVVYLHGKLTFGVTDLLYQPVCELVPTHSRIILDLKDLTHMDSMGIGTLLRLYVHAKAKHCTLELRNLGDRIRELMIMTNLLPIFTAFEHGMRIP